MGSQTIERDCDSYRCNVCADADTAFCKSCEKQYNHSGLIEREDPDNYTCGECWESLSKEQKDINFEEEQKAWAEEQRRKSIESLTQVWTL